MSHVFTYSISLKNVGCDHLRENGLPSDIPHLHGDLCISWQVHTLDKEVQSDGLLVGASKLILAEATDQRGLSDSTVAENDDFVLQVFGFLIFFIF